jgi:hypothetical protein
MLESKTGEVKIHDVKPEVMETLIYFIYNDAIQARYLNQINVWCDIRKVSYVLTGSHS